MGNSILVSSVTKLDAKVEHTLSLTSGTILDTSGRSMGRSIGSAMVSGIGRTMGSDIGRATGRALL